MIHRSSISEADAQARLFTEDIIFPTAEQILEDSTVLRSPLEPFFAIRSTGKIDGSLDLAKEIDVCPEYENFLRRSFRFISQSPPILLQREMILHEATPKLDDDQLLARIFLSSREQNPQTSASVVQVRFPGTVNLLQHTECFRSMEDALSGLCNYKLADLANFYVYDPASRAIDAHLIESPVPNPADLKAKGLQLHWMAQISSDSATDTTGDSSLLAESSHLFQRQPSRCDSAWEEFASEAINVLNEPDCTSSGMGKKSSTYLCLPANVSRDKTMSTTNSVFNDDFFLEDQSGVFSDQVSVADNSSVIRVLREAVSQEDIVAALELEEHVRATKTWVELAREARASTSHEDETLCSSVGDETQSSSQEDYSADEGVCDNPWQDSTFLRPFDEASSSKPTASPSQVSCPKSANIKFEYGGIDDIDNLYGSLDASRSYEDGGAVSTLELSFKPCCGSFYDSEDAQDNLKESTSSQKFRSSTYLELHNPSALLNGIRSPDTPNIDNKGKQRMNEMRQAPLSQDMIVDHSPGYHFTTVKHYMAEGSEEADHNAMDEAEEQVEVLYDFDGTRHDIDSEYSLADEDASSNLTENAKTDVKAGDSRKDSFQYDKSQTVNPSDEKVLAETQPNSLRHPSLDFRSEFDINRMREVEIAELQENKITLADLNIRPVGKAARPRPLSAKGKSKVGALVNIFQDYGLIPEQSRGLLQMSSVSPSFNRRSSQYRGEPSGTSVDSGKVRKMSATLSTGSRPVPSPVDLFATPNSILDRPHSRISDIDTEASFQFGEVLRRTRKHRESESEDISARDAEMYG